VVSLTSRLLIFKGYQGLSQRLLRKFYSFLIAPCFGLSDGHLQVNRTNYSKKLPTTDPLYFLFTNLIMYVNCKQLVSLSLLCIKFKYFKIFFC
jgi:hypothetical protein